MNKDIDEKPASSLSRKYAEGMKAYIELHFTERIALRDISQSVYLSTNYANRLFVQECGQTLYEYVTRCRVRLAEKLLTQTDKPIALIAELTGYRSKANFHLSFKKDTGMTPAQYRHKALSYRGLCSPLATR